MNEQDKKLRIIKTDEIIELLKSYPAKRVCINYSFGRKSTLLAWCAMKAGKQVLLRNIRSNRIFPDVLREMDRIIETWKGYGVNCEINEVECKAGIGKEIKSACRHKMIQFRKTRLDKDTIFVRTANVNSIHIAAEDSKISPLIHFTEKEIHAWRVDIPAELFLDLTKFNCPHYCANPICPYWKEEHPETLEKFKRWTDAQTG